MHIVFKEKTATHDELLKKAGLTTLYNLRLQDLKLAILNVPIYIQNMFEENGAAYKLCNGNDLNIPRFQTVG